MTDKELFGNSEQLNDLISRQDAIDAILHNQELYSNNFGNDPIDRYTIAIIDNDAQTIAQLPSAQQWIPTSERPPKVREWVLCQCRAGIMDVLRLTEDGSWNKNYPHAEYMSGFVIAWMPLPEQWKGEEHDTPRTMLPKKSLR